MPEELSKSLITKIIFYFFMLLVSATGWLLVDKVSTMTKTLETVSSSLQDMRAVNTEQKYQIENLQYRVSELEK